MTTQETTAYRSPPDRVVVYIPGTMQAFFDQTLASVARQLVQACNGAADATSYHLGPIEEKHLPFGGRTQICSLLNNSESCIQLICADYTMFLAEELKNCSVFGKLIRIVRSWVACAPMVKRVWSSTPRSGHSYLTSAHKRFLRISVALAFLVLLVTVISIWQLLGGSKPQWVALALVLLAALLPASLMSAPLVTGLEYYGVANYLQSGDKSIEIRRYFDAVFTYARDIAGAAPIHVACFSFGSLVFFDYLFPKTTNKDSAMTNIDSLTFIGFPYVLVEEAIPSYFWDRRWTGGGLANWHNLFLEDDVLGSRIGPYMDKMFGLNSHAVNLTDAIVRPQRKPGRWQNPFLQHWQNPFLRHLSYWDAKADAPCDALAAVARIALSTPENSKLTAGWPAGKEEG